MRLHRVKKERKRQKKLKRKERKARVVVTTTVMVKLWLRLGQAKLFRNLMSFILISTLRGQLVMRQTITTKITTEVWLEIPLSLLYARRRKSMWTK